jgi:hypothetical protein
MRGAIQYDDMLQLSVAERQIISDFVKSRLDLELSKVNPNY